VDGVEEKLDWRFGKFNVGGIRSCRQISKADNLSQIYMESGQLKLGRVALARWKYLGQLKRRHEKTQSRDLNSDWLTVVPKALKRSRTCPSAFNVTQATVVQAGREEWIRAMAFVWQLWRLFYRQSFRRRCANSKPLNRAS
jgi:hypothetical protein